MIFAHADSQKKMSAMTQDRNAPALFSRPLVYQAVPAIWKY